MTLAFIEFDHTFRTVLAGSTLVGIASGVVGSFAMLRRQSLVGDVISHSTIFGVVLAFLASFYITGTGSKSLYWLMPGAMLAGLAAMLLSSLVTEYGNVRRDSGLGVMLAIFFATGIAILRWLQRATPNIPGQRGLDEYLFGMAASMTSNDVVAIAILTVVVIGVVGLCWKELKVLSFDPTFAQSLGFRLRTLELTFLTLLIFGIVVGIQCIGVILMIAMLVIPATAAYHWTNRLGVMVVISGLLGGLNGAVGSFISASVKGLPTGPVVILVGIVTLAVSMLIGAKHGLLATSIRRPDSDTLAEQTESTLQESR